MKALAIISLLVALIFIGCKVYKIESIRSKLEVITARTDSTDRWFDKHSKLPKDSTELRKRTLDSIGVYLNETDRLLREIR